MNTLNYRYVASSLALLGIFVFAIYLTERDSAAQTIPGKIFWYSFTDGVNLAKTSNKKILVDVYTDWCGWCKKMDSDVYTDKEVVGRLNEHFILVKLNAESTNRLTYKGKDFSEADFAQGFGVNGYPTTLFFDENSNPITNLPGYAPPERFAKVLDFIGKDYYKSVSFLEFIEKQPTNQ